MRDIRDLISGSLHIEQIVFTQIVRISGGESQTNSYLGASSTGRFLLIHLPSSSATNQAIDASECQSIYARNSDTDFLMTGGLPIIATRPRTQQIPDKERAFHAIESILQSCLKLGLGLVKHGSILWDGDRFTAKYIEPDGVRMGTFKMTTSDGEDAPEHIKARFLADLEAEPKDRKMKHVFVRSEHRSLTAGEASRIHQKPAPGSIEAKIQAVFEARAKARIVKGIQGELLRDELGRATGVQLQSEPACRVQFHYLNPTELPPPFPHRVQTFIESAESVPGEPNSEIIIHSARISDLPLADAAFDPLPRLREDSFVRGILGADGRTRIPDPKDHLLLHKIAQKRRKQTGPTGEN